MVEIWKPNERAHDLSLLALAECLLDIRDARDILKQEEAIKKDNHHHLLRQMVRMTAVAVRKILDSKLLETCIYQPTLPAIASVGIRPRLELKIQRPEHSGVAVSGDGKEEKFSFPEATYEAQVHPLPGVEFGEGGKCTIRPPFATEGDGLKLGRWLNQRVIQIDSVVYTAEKLIRLIANFEGAHTHVLPTIVASGLSIDQVDSGPEMEYRAANIIRFGGLSYAQLFTFYTGIQVMHQASYVVANVLRRQRLGLGPGQTQQDEQPPPTLEVVIADPTFSTQVAYAGQPLYIFGEQHNPHPREGSLTRTVIGVPGISQTENGE